MKALVKKGLTPKQAVDFAYKQFPVMQTMHDEIYGQLGNEMVRGYGGDLPHEAIADALALSWTGDGLTLSDRTTAGSKIVKGFVRSTIEQEIRKGTNYKKLALKLFNGYKQGGLIPEQDIPKFMSRLIHASVGPGYNQKAFDRDFSKVEKQVAKLNTPGMRAAYTALLGAIEARNDQKLNKAIYGATQERTRYFAERIARTEMARAYNDGAMAKYMDDDDIEAVQWKLSSAHPCYDICDLYANADLYGLGKGIFPKDKVPMLPAHPNCMCHLKPVVVSQSTKRLPHERFEQGAREYISTASKAHRERLFGKFGSKLVEAGSPLTNHLRNYNGQHMVSRLELPYNKPIEIAGRKANIWVDKDGAILLTNIHNLNTKYSPRPVGGKPNGVELYGSAGSNGTRQANILIRDNQGNALISLHYGPHSNPKRHQYGKEIDGVLTGYHKHVWRLDDKEVTQEDAIEMSEAEVSYLRGSKK